MGDDDPLERLKAERERELAEERREAEEKLAKALLKAVDEDKKRGR